MTLNDYKYITGFYGYEDVSADEISKSLHVKEPFSYARVDGELYYMDNSSIDKFKSYKDSIEQLMINFSDEVNVPYFELYNEVIKPLKDGECIDSFLLENLYANSLFDKDIADAIKKVNEKEPKIFENVYKITYAQKEINYGECLMNDSAEHYKLESRYYTIDKVDSSYKVQVFDYNYFASTLESKTLCESIKPKECYKAIVKDNLDRCPNADYKVCRDIIDKAGLTGKVTPTDCDVIEPKKQQNTKTR